jgi:hypothetical protein
MLGEEFRGIACSDRWWAYNYLDPARRQVDDGFVDGAIAAGDDKGLASDLLPRAPRQHRVLLRFVEIDQREPHCRIRVSRTAKLGDCDPDFLAGQRIERMRRDPMCSEGDRRRERNNACREAMASSR